MDFDYYSYIVIPALIFIARICDVSMGTVRIILVSKGLKRVAPLIGFFEVLIWILAISKIIQNLDNWICYIAYAGGFATGNYIGMMIEEKLALGHELVRVITKREAIELVQELKNCGYGVTFISAEGTQSLVGVLYIIVSRKYIQSVIEIIQKHSPNAFYTIENIKYVSKDPFFGSVKDRSKIGFLRK